MQLSDAIKQAYEYAPGDVVYFDTLQIDHADFASPILVVCGHRPLTTNQGIYVPVLFSFSLPETAGSQRGQMRIAINGITRQIREALRDAARSSSPITVVYRQYLEGEMDPDAYLPVPLSVVNVTETFAGLEATAMLPDLVNMVFPKRLMTWTALGFGGGA
jgi:hypothetical protein